MPIIFQYGSPAGEGLGDALMAIKQQKMEQERLDLLTKRTEQEMKLQEEQAGQRKTVFEQAQQDRAREAQSRDVQSQGAGWLGAAGQPTAAGTAINASPLLPPQVRSQMAFQADMQLKIASRKKILEALTKVDPQAAQRFYQTSEVELRQAGSDFARTNIVKTLGSGLVDAENGPFVITHPSGARDQSAMEMAKGILQAAQDPNADPIKLAQATGELKKHVAEQNIHYGQIRTRAEQATQQLAARVQTGQAADADEGQALIHSLMGEDITPQEFDKQWPDALNGRLGIKRENEALQQENLRLINEAQRRENEAMRIANEKAQRPTIDRVPSRNRRGAGSRDVGERDRAVMILDAINAIRAKLPESGLEPAGYVAPTDREIRRRAIEEVDAVLGGENAGGNGAAPAPAEADKIQAIIKQAKAEGWGARRVSTELRKAGIDPNRKLE